MKEIAETLRERKLASVRKLKDDQIRQEILKIGEKDLEARKLEKKEQKVLKRLKETHLL